MVQGGGVTVRVPAGALDEERTITVDRLDGALTAPQPGLDVLTTYRLGPDRTRFSKPVVVAVSVQPDGLPAQANLAGNALVLVHAENDGTNPQVVGAWVGGEATLSGIASSFSLFEVTVLSPGKVGQCPSAPVVTCATDLACDESGVCGGTCNVVVGTAGHELGCASGGANTVTCTCHGPTATSNDAFLLPPFLGPTPPARLVWEYLRHCDDPCGAADAGAGDAASGGDAGDGGGAADAGVDAARPDARADAGDGGSPDARADAGDGATKA
jgi:hypothetical protein